MSISTGMFGLRGTNGAGKTTLMRILAGILRPTSGQIDCRSFDLNTPKGRASLKRVLGYLPQELGLYPDLTAAELLDYVAILKGVPDGAARRKQITELLEMVGLADVANHKLRDFSGGMKRRGGIAQALLNNLRRIIVDESTAGLDPEKRIRSQ